MKKLFLTLLIAMFMFSCEKENLSKEITTEAVETVDTSELATKAGCPSGRRKIRRNPVLCDRTTATKRHHCKPVWRKGKWRPNNPDACARATRSKRYYCKRVC